MNKDNNKKTFDQKLKDFWANSIHWTELKHPIEFRSIEANFKIYETNEDDEAKQ